MLGLEGLRSYIQTAVRRNVKERADLAMCPFTCVHTHQACVRSVETGGVCRTLRIQTRARGRRDQSPAEIKGNDSNSVLWLTSFEKQACRLLVESGELWNKP